MFDHSLQVARVRFILGGFAIALLCFCSPTGARPDASREDVGRRPYEMVWAGRTEDTRAPLVDFENLEGWTVQCRDAVASFSRSREQQLWGRYVGKLVYRGTGPQPKVTIRLAEPAAVPRPFDCINLWCYGNNWAWAPDPSTPQVQLSVVLEGANRRRVRVSLDRVRWKEWWLVHRRLSAEQLEQLGHGPVHVVAIEVAGGRNKDDRVLYFDNLAVYKEQLRPLRFQPRPKRGIDLPPGQTVGTNTGPGRLPFPTREETILPTNRTERFKTTLAEVGGEGGEPAGRASLPRRCGSKAVEASSHGTKTTAAEPVRNRDSDPPRGPSYGLQREPVAREGSFRRSAIRLVARSGNPPKQRGLHGPEQAASESKPVEGGCSPKRYLFRYEGDDGVLEYRYRPETGTLGDITAVWVGRGKPFRPLVDGGVYFWVNQRPDGSAEAAAPERIELIRCQREGEVVRSTWRLHLGERSAEVTYTLRLWQKSLVIDVQCLGGQIGEFRIGRVVGVENPRLVTVPYLTGDAKRPAVLVIGPPERPLFLLPLIDHTRSNSSLLWFENRIGPDGVVQNGGSRYRPKTDGERNPCFERLFLTVSPRFDEVLPNIPNPKSPWMHVAGERLWRAHGASNRRRDYEHWKRIARYGMTKVVITDHETGWRDGGESFTLRTRAAPGKGGDEGQRWYARKLIDELGFRYGIYNNYTDYAPVNEHWDEDCVTRLPDGEWRRAWARCYNLKPARAVEFEARLAPIIQQKFQLNTAYCDVHTAVRPWSYCDFDARVPGAATFAATFYAYGEIMLHQKKTWNGPVYSEGNNHWYYCGLTDGNYAQDQLARLDRNPWLVDFDLLKMHPLCCNFGMGNLGMFFGRRNRPQTAEERQRRLDRFLAATLAFGHTGFLVLEGGFESAVQSYFCVQQVAAAYAQATAETIRYADSAGRLLDTSAAVATGAYRRSQLMVRYSNGLEVWVNGNASENWTLPIGRPQPTAAACSDHRAKGPCRPQSGSASGPCLPPNGWFVRDTREGKLTAWSAIVEGHRADYVDSPAYIYANGRGRLTRFEKATCDGPLIAHLRKDGTLEVIPVGPCRTFGVWVGGQTATAQALDEARTVIGPARTRFSRGLVYVEPVEGAFSYVLTPAGQPESELHCDRLVVVPGERVTIRGARTHEVRIPADAPIGEQFWCRLDGAWIDFTVKPLATTQLQLTRDGLELTLVPHLPQKTKATVSLGNQARAVELVPERPLRLKFRRPAVERASSLAPSAAQATARAKKTTKPSPARTLALRATEMVLELPLAIRAGELKWNRAWWLKAEEGIQPLWSLSPEVERLALETGQQLRGQDGKPLGGGTRAAVYWTQRSCGGQSKRCLFMHPPYVGGVGAAFAVLEPVTLPADWPAAFRCLVGKADGSVPGDGILFRIAVIDSSGKEAIAAEKQWIHHAWTPLEADLSRWSGQQVRIKLIADVGPKDNSSGDWACWADLRIESLRPVLGLSIHDRPVQLARRPGPYPLPGLTVADLRRARRAVLHFKAIGLQKGGQYVSYGKLNGVALGPLPAGGGDERHGRWAAVTIPLPAEAIASLNQWNIFSIDNPGHDSFKVKDFWIELTLPDGRKASSQITGTVYTQPPNWLHAEGELVPFGHAIQVQVRFRVESGQAASRP